MAHGRVLTVTAGIIADRVISSETLCLSEILASTSLAPSAHLSGHAMGYERDEGSTQDTRPSTIPQHEASQTIESSVQFALPTISYLINTHLPRVRGLILVLDDEVDEDDEAAFREALEDSSQVGHLGNLSYKVKRGS